MTDLAALGIKVSSDGVVTTTKELNAFAKASNAARAAAKPIAIRIGNAGLAKTITDIERVNRAMRGMGGSGVGPSVAVKGVNTAIQELERLLRTVNEVRAAARSPIIVNVAMSGSGAARSGGRGGGGGSARPKIVEDLEEVQKSFRFTAQEGLNFSRQMADIGVTAAMGMNPLMIAIQQGPQLFDIMQTAGMRAGVGIGGAFKAALVTMAPFIAAATAVAAVLGTLALALKSVNDQANANSGLKKYTTEMGYTKDEVERLNSVTVTMGDTFKAVFQVGFERIAGYFGTSTEEISSAWDRAVKFIKDAARTTVAVVYALFAGMSYGVREIFNNLGDGIANDNPFMNLARGYKQAYDNAQSFMDDVAKQAGENALKRQDEMAKKLYDAPKVKKPKAVRDTFGFDDLLKDAARIERDLRSVATTVGVYGEELARVNYENDLFNKAADNNLKLTAAQADQVRALSAELARLSEANRLAIFREETKQGAMQQLQALKDAEAQIGVYGQELAALRYEQEMLNKAIADHIMLTDTDRERIRQAAEILGGKEYKNTIEQSRVDNARWHAEQMRQLDSERIALNLVGFELVAYRYEQELINKALEAGIAFKDIDIDKTRRQALAYAEGRVELERQADRMNNVRDAYVGFMQDWTDKLREGQNVFKSFADAIINSLNRILDKLLDSAFDNIGGSIGALFGGGMSAAGIGRANLSVADTIAANPSIFAKGGAFGVPHQFAKGGTFTNSVVSKPTLFRFANGGALGEMGEAGPEAIMPLKRGPDGSLGVVSHGNDNGKLHVSVSVDDSGGLRALVRNEAGAIVAQSAPVIATAGSKQAEGRIRQKDTRRLA